MTPPPHDNPSASVKPPPAAALPDAIGDGGKGEGGGGGKIPSARTRLLSPSSSTKPPACSSDPARPASSACPAAASGPAVGAIAAAVDGDAAAGEKVTRSAWGTCGTGAGRASVAADVAVVAVVVSAAGGLGGDQGGASPAAPTDAAEGCLTRPAELGLGLGAGPPAVPAEAGAEAEAPGREEFALRGEVSGTPRVAPSAVSVLAVAAAAAAAVEETSGREGIDRKSEDVLEEEALKDDEPVPFPSRTPPGIKGKGFHSTARRGISGRDGDSSAGRGEGEGAVLSGAAQAALPKESVTGMEAKLCLPAKHVSGGAEEREVAVAAVAAVAAAVEAAAVVGEVVEGEVKGGWEGSYGGEKFVSSTSTQASTLVPAGERSKEVAAVDGEGAASAATAAAAAKEAEGTDSYRGDAAYAGLLIAEHLELFFRQQVRFFCFIYYVR